MMKPVILLSLFFSVLGSFQLFDLIIPLTGGDPLNSTHSMVSYLYTFGIKRMRLGYGSAVALILFVICVVVMACYKRFLLREDRTNLTYADAYSLVSLLTMDGTFPCGR